MGPRAAGNVSLFQPLPAAGLLQAWPWLGTEGTLQGPALPAIDLATIGVQGCPARPLPCGTPEP